MNCKPGDMAKLIDAHLTQAIGLLVDVVRLDPRDEGLGPMWRCRAISGAKSDIGFCLPGSDCLIPDKWLRPIRPDGITTEEVKELFSPSPAKESEKV